MRRTALFTHVTRILTAKQNGDEETAKIFSGESALKAKLRTLGYNNREYVKQITEFFNRNVSGKELEFLF